MKKYCWMFGIALWCWGILLATPAGAANALYESNFANGGKDWTAVKNATLVKPPICLNPQP